MNSEKAGISGDVRDGSVLASMTARAAGRHESTAQTDHLRAENPVGVQVAFISVCAPNNDPEVFVL